MFADLGHFQKVPFLSEMKRNSFTCIFQKRGNQIEAKKNLLQNFILGYFFFKNHCLSKLPMRLSDTIIFYLFTYISGESLL